MALEILACRYSRRLLFEVLSFIRIGSANSGVLGSLLGFRRWGSVSFLMLKTHLFCFLFCYGACQTGARLAGVKASATKNPLPARTRPPPIAHFQPFLPHQNMHPLPPNTSAFFVTFLLQIYILSSSGNM